MSINIVSHMSYKYRFIDRQKTFSKTSFRNYLMRLNDRSRDEFHLTTYLRG